MAGGAARRLPGRKSALRRPGHRLLGQYLGGQKGDIVRVSLIAPDGEAVAENAMVVERNMAQWFAFTGRKRQGDTWPEGVYRGEYMLIPKAGSAERPMLSIDREIMIE